MKTKKNAANKFEKVFFKLVNNNTFSKTMENLKRSICVRLAHNAKGYIKYTSKPCFVSQKIFNKNLVAIHEIKPVLILYKTIYIGFIILDLNKLLTYKFHYNYIKKHLVPGCYLQTQTVIYEIEKWIQGWIQIKNN